MKSFDEFVTNGIVKKQSPDNSRAKYLIEEAEKSYGFLLKKIDKIGVDDESASDLIKTCCNIIMELIRAKMLLEGYNASVAGAYEAGAPYTQKLGFSQNNINFLDQLRYFRKGIVYYGTNVKKEYAEKAIIFTKKFIKN